jgi:hypothetical protein
VALGAADRFGDLLGTPAEVVAQGPERAGLVERRQVLALQVLEQRQDQVLALVGLDQARRDPGGRA